MKSVEVVSAGGVVYRIDNGKVEVALILRGKNWGLPKGLIEPRETPEQTAVREVREETGLRGELLQKLGDIKYNFVKEVFFSKTVHFFLLKYLEGSIEDHDYEVDKVEWFPIDEAVKILAYPNERRMAEKAREILQSKT